MTLTSFFQEIFRTFLYRVSLDRRTLLTIHDPGLRLLASDGTEKGNSVFSLLKNVRECHTSEF